MPIFHTRFAPTPSGYLHLGNVLSFAVAWAIAKQQNGFITLRIDDLYNAHFKTEHLEDIFDTLSFLGLDYENGSKNTEDFYLHHSQQHKIERYNALLTKLVEMGKVYACACSRSQLQHHTPDGHYTRICLNKNLDLDSPDVAWRIKISEEEVVELQDQIQGTILVPLGKTMPDFIVRRKDKVPSYQTTSLIDDVTMKINYIVRGQDLLHSTAAQLYLAKITGMNAFLETKFLHHPLLKDIHGNKLSKSEHAQCIHQMRQQGYTSEDVWIQLSNCLGWTKDPVTNARDFAKRFNPKMLGEEIA